MLIQRYACKRCGREWSPRLATRPRVCPKCKSPYWDKERTLPEAGENTNGSSERATANELLQQNLDANLPKLKESRFVIGFQMPLEQMDAPAALQLGAAVLLDKPLLTIVLNGEPVSRKVRLISDAIVEVDSANSAEGKRKVRDAIIGMLRKLNETK